MQSINLVRYINLALSPNSYYSNINNTNINSDSISKLVNNNSVEYGDFTVNSNCLVQNFHLESGMNDLRIVRNVILCSNQNPGILVSFPCFCIRFLDSLNLKISKLTNYIASLVVETKDGLDKKVDSLARANSVVNKVYSIASISLLVILLNLIFTIVYLSQVLYIMFFLFFNFMISVFYIL